MAQADGTILIDTEIDADGMKAGSKEIELAIENITKTAKKMSDSISGYNQEAIKFIEEYVNKLEGASNSNNEFKKTIEKAKKELSSLEGKGLYFGDEEYDNAFLKLQKVTQALKDYKKELVSPTPNANPFGLDTLSGKIVDAEIELKKLIEAGKGLGDEQYDKVYRKLALLKDEAKQYAKEISKTPAQVQKEAEALAKKEAQQKAAKAKEEARIIELNKKLEQTRAKEVQAIMEANRLKEIGDNAEISRKDIVSLNEELEQLKIRQKDLEKAGLGFGFEEYDKNSKRIAKINSKLSDYKKALIGTSGAQSKASSTVKPLYSVFKKLSNTLSRTSSALKRYFGNLVKTVSSMSMFRKETDRTRMSLAKMLAMSILFSAVFRAISAVTGGLATGFQNLSLYSERTNQDISMLMSALTQLKNSFATAFAPILTVVAPILTSFINMISQAVTYIGMFWASLFGQDYFIKAVPVQEDYASTLEDTTSNLEDVADATKEAEKAAEGYLSPIDEINKMQKEINASEIATVPTVGSPAIITPGDMFEKVPINSKIQSFVKKLKDLVKKEDWNGLGKLIASKINGMLQYVYDAINWDNVGPRITKFTYAFTETFNSLVDNIDWDLLGRTIGAGINTLVNTLNQLADGIDWFNLGRKIADGINGLFDEVDWYNLGHLIGNYFRIAWDVFGGIVTNLDYAKIGRSVAEGLNGVFKTISFSDIAYYLSTALNGAFTALESFTLTFDWQNLVDNIAGGINKFISTFDWKGNAEKLNLFIQNLLQTLLDIAREVNWEELGKGIADFITGIDWWSALTKVVETIATTLGGLFDGLEASGTAGKIAAFLGKAFIAVKIANITGLTSLVGGIISYIISKFETADTIKKLSDALGNTLSGSSKKAAEAFETIGDAAETAAGTASGKGLTGFAKALAPLVGEAGLIVGVGVAATAALSGLRNFIETMQGGNGVASAFGAAMDSYFDVLLEKSWISSDTATKLFELKESLETGNMSATEMKEATNQLMQELSNSGITADQARQAFDLLRGQYQMSDEMVDALTLAIDGMSNSLVKSTTTIPNTKEAFASLEQSTKLLRDEFKLSSDQMTAINTVLYETDGSSKSAQDAFNAVIAVLQDMGVNTEEAASFLEQRIPGAVREVETSVDTHMTNTQKKIESTMKSAKNTTSKETSEIEKDVKDSFTNVDDTTVLKWGNSSREVELNLRAMKIAASQELAKMTETVRSYSDSMYNIMTKKFEYMARDIGGYIAGISQTIINEMNSAINSINSAIYSINNSLGGIERAFTFSYDMFNPMTNTRYWGSYSLSLPRVNTIPYLASGAVIPPNKEFLAVLGDQKQGTNIEAPLSTIEQAVRNVIGDGGNAQYRIPIYINGRQILEAVVDEGELKRRRSGSNPFALGGV